jgi:hypothetical protein
MLKNKKIDTYPFSKASCFREKQDHGNGPLMSFYLHDSLITAVNQTKITPGPV